VKVDFPIPNATRCWISFNDGNMGAVMVPVQGGSIGCHLTETRWLSPEWYAPPSVVLAMTVARVTLTPRRWASTTE
jgi:hypothetical protein